MQVTKNLSNREMISKVFPFMGSAILIHLFLIALDTFALNKFLTGIASQVISNLLVDGACMILALAFAVYMQTIIAKKVPFIVKENKNEILKSLVSNAKVMVVLVFLVSLGLAIYTTIIEVKQEGNNIAHEENANALQSGNNALNAKLLSISESYKQQRSDLQMAKEAEIKAIENDFLPKINNLKAKSSSVSASSPEWSKGLSAEANGLFQKMESKKSVIEKEYAGKFNDLNAAQKTEEKQAESLKSEIITTAATGASLKLGSFNKLSYFLGGFTLLCYFILLINLHGRALAAKHAGEDLTVVLGNYEEKVNMNNFFHSIKERFLYCIFIIINKISPDEIIQEIKSSFESITDFEPAAEQSIARNYSPVNSTIGFHSQNNAPTEEMQLNVQSNFMAEQKEEALRVLNSKANNPEQQGQKKEVESFEVIPTEKLLMHAERDIKDKLRINAHRQKTQLGKGSTFETTQKNIETANNELKQIHVLREKQRKQINIFDVINDTKN